VCPSNYSRRRSSTNPKSFYRCDQCQYEYKFGRVFAAYDGLDRFTLARILQMRFAVHFVSVLVLLLLIFIGGFITKLFTPGLTWGDVFNFLNLQHFTGGSVLLGMGSLIGWLASLFASAPGMSFFSFPCESNLIQFLDSNLFLVYRSHTNCVYSNSLLCRNGSTFMVFGHWYVPQ